MYFVLTMKKAILFVFFSFLFFFDGFSFEPLSSFEIYRHLQSLRSENRVLFIGLFPEDENIDYTTYSTNVLRHKTLFYAFSKGEQGETSPFGNVSEEVYGILKDAEAEQKTQEDNVLRILGNASDMRYADSHEEVQKQWFSEKYDVVLELVRVIRSFKPDIIIWKTPQKEGATYQKKEFEKSVKKAFQKSGEKAFMKKKLKSFSAWKAPCFLENVPKKIEKGVSIEIKNQFLPLLGKSLSSFLKREPSLFPREEKGLKKTNFPPKVKKETSLFAFFRPVVPEAFSNGNCIETSIQKEKNGRIDSLRESAIKYFSLENPQKILPLIIALHREMKKKTTSPSQQFEDIAVVEKILLSLLGIEIKVEHFEPSTTPRGMLHVTISAEAFSDIPVVIEDIYFFNETNYLSLPKEESLGNTNAVIPIRGGAPAQKQLPPQEVPLHTEKTFDRTFFVPLPYGVFNSLPMWIVEKRAPVDTTKKKSQASQTKNTPKKEGVQRFSGKVRLKIGTKKEKTRLLVEEPITFYDPFSKKRKEVVIKDPVSVSLDKKNYIGSSGSHSLKITVEAHQDFIKGVLRLDVPTGYQVSPLFKPFQGLQKGEKRTHTFTIQVPEEEIDTLQRVVPVAKVWFHNCSTKFEPVFSPSLSKEIPFFSLSEAYVFKTLSTDTAQKHLWICEKMIQKEQQERISGIIPTIIFSEKVERLDSYKSIIIDTRTAQILSSEKIKRLEEYTRNGGTLFLLQNTPVFSHIESIFPYFPGKTWGKVIDETTEILSLDTVLQEICPFFDKWVTYRGLFFPTEYDKKNYSELLQLKVSEEKTLPALLSAKMGKGNFFWTSLDFQHQFEHGTGKAFSAFLFLLEAYKNETF